MKPPRFSYVRPDSLTEALKALAGSTDAKVLAGGQSLVPLLSMRLAAPGTLVDINGLPELDRIEVGADGVRIGALVRHADLLADDAAAAVQPLVRSALRLVAHGTIRNRGTTVGSLVHADPAAEMPMVLRLLEGSVTVASVRGTREIGAAELFAGPMENSLAADELAIAAWFPALPAGHGVAIDEVARRHGDYGLCGVAADVVVDGDRVTRVRAGYLSVSEVPTVVDLGGAFESGKLDDAALHTAGESALTQLEPQDDIHATAAYRAQLVRTLTARVVRAAYEDAVARADEREKR